MRNESNDVNAQIACGTRNWRRVLSWVTGRHSITRTCAIEIGNLPESSRAFSAKFVQVVRPGGRVVITGFDVVVIVGFRSVVADGVVRLAAGSVDDTGVVVTGRLDVLVAADEDVECAAEVVLLSTAKWLKSVGGTVVISAVGLGRGRGDFVVSTYETVTRGSAVVAVMFGFRVPATVTRC